MKAFYLTLVLWVLYIPVWSQEYAVKDEIELELTAIKANIQNLQSSNTFIKNELVRLNQSLLLAQDTIMALKEQILTTSDVMRQTSSSLDTKIESTEVAANQRIDEVGESISYRTLLIVCGLLLALLATIAGYWMVSKRQRTDKTDIIDRLGSTKASIEESLVKEFGKQTELIDSSILLMEKQRAIESVQANVEVDHSLALRVASEINLIERNVRLMDAGTRGLKQLTRSVEKLKDNLSANGYEMPQLMGRDYNEGLKIIVLSSIPDETLEQGAEIISKIMIPQVNYNDKMIQVAQVEVSVGVK
ncbi:MAG: septum formation initiator [Saprospiraceae bacterium]|nr:septum formation initiator [Saprospiraceae bacterium]